MNEKTLLIICYCLTCACILPFRKRMSKRLFMALIVLLPLVVYAFVIGGIVLLAITYGDK